MFALTLALLECLNFLKGIYIHRKTYYEQEFLRKVILLWNFPKYINKLCSLNIL
jgi:hypothetical protein